MLSVIWPGKKVKASHIAQATGGRVKHAAWALRWNYTYFYIGGGAVFRIEYIGASPGLVQLHPDITISYKIRLILSKLNVFKG